MQTINISGVEFEAYYNVKAQMDIAKRCGGLKNLSKWIGENDEPAEIAAKVLGVITSLINGAVYKHNCEIAFGMKQGDKKEFIDDDVLLCIADISKLEEYMNDMYRVMNGGAEFVVPDDVQTEERDPDLDFVPSESEKNS